MATPDYSDLIGEEIAFQVSEPWDFEMPDGTNIIRARITSVQGITGLRAEAFEDVEFPEKGVQGRRLDIRARYEGQTLRLVRGKSNLTAGLGLDDGKKIHYVAIGSVELLDENREDSG